MSLVAPLFSLLTDIFSDFYGIGLSRRLWHRRRSNALLPSSQASLDELPLIRQFDFKQRRELLSEAQDLRLEAGDFICRQGDHSQSLYILLDGEVMVRKKLGSRRKVVALLSPGAVFGEAAFFLGTPRTADVIATDVARVLEIPKRNQQALVDIEKSQELQARIWLLQALVSLRAFQGLPTEAFDALIFAGSRCDFKAKEVVFREGEAGDAFYLIVQGEASVFQKGHHIRTMTRGDVFGEIAILNPGVNRTATVSAATDLIVVRIPAAEFRDLLCNNWPLAIELERIATGRLIEDHQRSAS